MVEKPTAGRPASPNGGLWKNQLVRLVSPMFAAGEFRKYQPVTAVTAPASSSGTLFLLFPCTSARGDGMTTTPEL